MGEKNKTGQGRPLPPAIPDHAVIRRIGAGSYGEVWLARNAIGALRAVKIVWRLSFKSDRPYEREFSGMLKFEPLSRSHEGFVDILQIGRNNEAGYFYYVMELADDVARLSLELEINLLTDDSPTQNPAPKNSLENWDSYRPCTLSSESRAGKKLPAAVCVRHFLTLTSALDALHRGGLIHRDIKPSNIIVVGGVAKLADIGLVATIDSERSFVGTEGFIPPEGPGSVSADIYSLGKVLYEVASGHDRMEFPSLPYNPQTGQTEEELLELNSVLLRACNSDVKERYASAAEMQADLALLRSGRSVRHIRAVERKLRVALRAGQVAALLALVGFLLAFFYIRQTRVEKENFRRSEQLRQEREVALVEANLARASAERLSGRVGRRFAALGAVTRATELGGSSAALRSEAVAALAMTDLLPELDIKDSRTITTVQHAFSPDMQSRALADTNGAILILQTSDNRELMRLSGEGKAARWVGPFSPDGRKLALYTSTFDVVVRDLASGAELLHLTNEAAWNSGADPGWWVARGFSPDSRRFAVAHAGGRVTLHDLADGGTREFTLPSHPVVLAFQPRGNKIAFGFSGDTNQVALLNLDSGEIRSFNLPSPNSVFSLAWDDAGKQLAMGAGDNLIYVCEPESRQPKWKALTGHQQTAVALAFHPGGRLLISSGWDSTTRLWDVSDARQVAQMPLWGWDFIFSHDGRRLSFYDAELGSLRIFSIIDGAVGREIRGNPDQEPNQLAFAPDGSWLCVPDDASVKFFDPQTTRLLGQLEGAAKGVAILKGSSATNYSLLLTRFNHLESWPLQRSADAAWVIRSNPVVMLNKTGNLINSPGDETYGLHAPDEGLWIGSLSNAPRLMDESQYYRKIVLSPDGKFAASTRFLHGQPGRDLVVWDTATGKIFCQRPVKGRGGLAFSPDSRRLATTSLEGVMVWDFVADKILWRVDKPGTPDVKDCLNWSPDGRLLALTCTLLEAGLMDAATGELITRLDHMEPSLINSLTFSPDSALLAVACENSRVQLWDLRELRRELVALKLDWNHPPIPPAVKTAAALEFKKTAE